MFLSVIAYSQQTPPPETKKTNDDDIIRVNVNLVQVEAIVKDKQGKIITDLQKSDFEIEENGKTYPLEFLTFISDGENREAVRPHNKRLTKNEVRRTFVFMLENPLIDYAWSNSNANGTSSGSVSNRSRVVSSSESAAKFLHKFIDQQMGDSDLVSIFDTGKDLGVLSSFTNNREMLHAAVKQISDNLGQGRYPVVRITSVNGNMGLQPLIRQNLSVLKMLENAAGQLQNVPGRKVVVLLSRGLLYDPRLPGSEIVRDKMQDLIKKLNQMQVTFYTLGLSGVGNQGGIRGSNLLQGLQDLDSVKILADETGGRAIYNTNDVGLGFSEILKENKGYYVLAYNPTDESLLTAHQIKVKVKNPDLIVQTRTTAYNKNSSSQMIDENEALFRIVRSPFSINDILLDLSPTFQLTAKNKGRLTSVLKIEAKELAPELQADGTRLIKLDLAIQVKAPDNKLIREEIKKYTLRLDEIDWAQTQREGLVYQFDTNFSQEGYYQVNVAARLVNSGRIGSISHFINIKR